MMKLVFLLCCLVITINSYAQPRQVDICVYGGTSAGVIAAYTAKMSGKSVLLIEPGNHLGGLSSGGLGYTDIGNKYAVSGIARDFYRRIGQHYGKFEQWIFEPHVAEDIFKQYIDAAKAEVLYQHRIVSATVEKSAITTIVLENSSGNGQQQTIAAKIFIDCSYEGDLMAKAKVSYKVGREANKDYNETYNGVQLRDKHQFIDGIDPYKTKGKPESGLLWGISSETALPNGTGDKKVQAYNFRICLTNDPKNMVPITKPDDYDSTRYELLVRMMEKEPNCPFNLIMKPDMMPNNKTDINNNGPFSTDMIGMNYTYPEASYDERRNIIKAHENYNKGFLYFIATSKRLPPHLGTEMRKWGYPKDEYTDNNNWSPQAYIREARRMVGEYVMTQANCEGRATVEDGVGMAAYTMDSHNIQRVVVNGMVKNEGDVQIGGFPPYPISYRSLVPKKSECTNLFVPVCLSATHIAYGSIRMEPVFMVLAQSSAVAAVMAIDKKTAVQDVNVKLVQQKLKSDPLGDKSIPEILVDNDDPSGVVVEGRFVKLAKAPGVYGASLLADTTVNDYFKPSSVKFVPAVAKAGMYNVYVYCPRTPKGTTKLTVTVFDGKTKKDVVISPNDVKVEGQTSGEWINLGKYQMPAGKSGSVSVTNKGMDGIVVADAVLFVPAK
ncbi:MAG TPA: FAD-dependent oxidoreductase [Cyclobacteriaceae bacterium]|nr:FAD-dependent oxidoreductase [Cyclobacteriaceae bacterium]